MPGWMGQFLQGVFANLKTVAAQFIDPLPELFLRAGRASLLAQQGKRLAGRLRKGSDRRISTLAHQRLGLRASVPSPAGHGSQRARLCVKEWVAIGSCFRNTTRCE